MASFSPALASTLGRTDQVRAGGLEGRGSTAVIRTGQGRIFGAGGTKRGGIWGQGATAAGLSSEARIGSSSANLNLDTGTISTLFMGGIVVGIFAFYIWTRSAQA